MSHSPAPKAGGSAFGTFIVSNSLDKPDPKTRKLIRSYVMRGKNKRRPRGPAPSDDVVAAQRLHGQEPSVSTALPNQQTWVVIPPSKFYSEFSLLGLEEDLHPHMKTLIYQAFTVVKPATHAVQDLVLGNPDDEISCIGRLAEHPAMPHTMVFAAQAFYERTAGISYGIPAQYHLAKALKYLRESLDDPSNATSNSILSAVTSLAMGEMLLGELETAGHHMDGLARMIELRGGFMHLGKGAIVEHKARSIDLGLAMGMGSEVRFPQNPSWDSNITRRNFVARFPELNLAQVPFDPKLASVWGDLLQFSRSAEAAAASGVKIPVHIFTNISKSVPHRLLSLRYSEASLLELLRLSMIAYTKTILIRVKGVGPRMAFLAEKLKVAILTQMGHETPPQAALFLWSLFTAAVSIFEGCEEDWLREALMKTMLFLRLQTWSDTRGVLRAFLWADIIHGSEGEEVFERLFCRLANEVHLERT